jgi:putative nucleotidyltransferase with HDIG domain
MGIFYRGRQFWRALTAKPTRSAMAEAQAFLSPELYTLFTRLQPSEIAHAIAVFKKVQEESDDPDLLTAALLHDIGKIVAPLALWERVFIVVARRFGFGKRLDPLVKDTMDARPTGWTRGLVIAEKHPAWGAQLAHRAGASQTVVRLIRRHQDPYPLSDEKREDRLLGILQNADKAS